MKGNGAPRLPAGLAAWFAIVARFLGMMENHVAWFQQRATQQFVAGERGIAPFATGFALARLAFHRPRHLNSDVRRLFI